MTRPIATPPPDHALAPMLRCPRRRGVLVALDECLERYVSANAFGTRSSRCFRCPTGTMRRRDYAEGREVQ